MISRLFCGFWSLCFLMYSHTLLTTSGRGKGAEPTMAANSGEGCNGLRKAEVAFLPSLGSAFPCLGFSGVEGGMWSSLWVEPRMDLDGSHDLRVLEGGLHQPIWAEIVPVFHLQHRGKLSASPVDAAFERAHGNTAQSRRVLVGLALFHHQKESLALFQRQMRQCLVKVVQHQFEFLLGLNHQASGKAALWVFDLPSVFTVLRVDAIAQDREQPCLQVGAMLEVIEVRPRPQKGTLHEIVTPDWIAGQMQRKCSQVGQKGGKLIAHVLRAATRADLLNQGEMLDVREWMDVTEPCL